LPIFLRKPSPFQFFCKDPIVRKLRSMTTPCATVALKDIVFPDQANHYGTPPEEVLKGCSRWWPWMPQGRPVPIDRSYLEKETA
jgi:hypothetical protein